MVRQIRYENRMHYYCGECKLLYKYKKWAEKCEVWCKDNNSCSIKITKHSIKKTLEDIKNGKS